MSTERQYELMYIVSPEASDQDLADLHAQVEAIVTRFGGRIDRSEPMGRRKLAYEIRHHREGIYVLEVMTGPGEMVKELDRRLKVIDKVMRHLIVRVDEELRVAARRKAAREAEAARRREARGEGSEAVEGELPEAEGSLEAGDEGTEADLDTEAAEVE
jgi:small subunit ribosomal protein S6